MVNLSTLALALLAWQMFRSRNTDTAPKGPNLSAFLSDDTRNVIDCVSKLTGNNTSNDDKMGAILQMLGNPVVMDLAQSFLGRTAQEPTTEPTAEPTTEPQAEPQNDTPPQDTPQEPLQDNTLVNSEGYVFDEPSEDCKEFFKPINTIADAEVKHKLYWFYENWYIK